MSSIIHRAGYHAVKGLGYAQKYVGKEMLVARKVTPEVAVLLPWVPLLQVQVDVLELKEVAWTVRMTIEANLTIVNPTGREVFVRKNNMFHG